MRTELAPPAESAPETDVVIENSAIESDVGRLGRKSSEFTRMKLSWMLMPSSVTCVHVGRPPLMLVFVRFMNGCTPGCSLIRFVTSRFASGMSSTCRCRTVALTSGVVVDTSDEPAVTSTCSVIAPSSSFGDSEYSCPTTIVTCVECRRLEALQRELHLVVAGRNLRNHVAAVLAGNGRLRLVRVLVRDRDRRARECCPGRIEHGAAQAPERGLRGRSGRKAQYQYQREQPFKLAKVPHASSSDSPKNGRIQLASPIGCVGTELNRSNAGASPEVLNLREIGTISSGM